MCGSSGSAVLGCLGIAGTNPEAGDSVSDSSFVVATAVVEAILSGKLLQSIHMLSDNYATMIQQLTLFLPWSLDRRRSTMVWAHETEEETIASLSKIQQSCAWDCS